MSTLTAIDVDGTTIHFTDHVGEGDVVQLWEDPEAEEGFLGARVVVLVDEEWRLRHLSDQERQEQVDRLLDPIEKEQTA